MWTYLIVLLTPILCLCADLSLADLSLADLTSAAQGVLSEEKLPA